MAPTFPPPATTDRSLRPFDIGVIDTMVGFPQDPAALYRQIRASLRDKESRDEFVMPAAYMFHDVPASHLADDVDPVALVLGEMDRHGVEIALISLSANTEAAERALTEHPGRFVGSWSCDPNRGMEGIRTLVRVHEQWGVRAVSLFPHGVLPQVAIDAPQMYPIYAKCVELGIPVFVTVGIAGPRVPSMVQHVELVDRVMYDFPELVFVMRHGAEPWTDLAVKLMIKWPNLYYSTSAFSPRYYPANIIDYANTRGADRILYGGYFPMGLSLDRIMTELAQLPLKEDVWPKFLRENAARVLGLAEKN
ncbi:amidohydrolase family protein [Parafrankia soli]|nr:amidohydrolase family protein [Parafrankia soli]